MLLKRGLLQSFDPTTYSASVLLLEATTHALSNVPIANHVDGTSAIVGALCVVLFFDEHNLQDATIIATFSNSSQGFPTPPPGRVTFVTGFRQINATVIAANTTSTFTLVGGSSGIPSDIKGVVYKAFFTSATQGSSIHLAPQGAADLTAYATIGNLPQANGTLHGGGLLSVDSIGRIDIRANVGACTVTLYTYGYVM